MTEIIDRKMAIAMGLKRFFTGKPCKNGHVAERFVSGSHCIVCNSVLACHNRVQNREADRRYREKNSEKIKERKRNYHALNREKERARSRLYSAQNRERLREKDRRRYAKIALILEAVKQLNVPLPEITL